jgi:hypothetical protein
MEATLRQVGFVPGAPAHCRKDAVKDAAAYRCWPCTSCGQRTTQFRPFRRGIIYRALLVCKCGNAEEA